MPSVLDAAPPRAAPNQAPPARSRETPAGGDPAARLQSTMAAVRLSFRWLGVQKTLTAAQRTEAAEGFGAEGKALSAAKKVLDTGHPAFRAVTAVRGKMVGLWKAASVPYPEPGVRLIPRDRIAAFDAGLTDLRVELDDAVRELDHHFEAMKAAAAGRLGRLFNPADYPETLVGWFAVAWDYPSVAPPDWLRELSPHLYEQETRRMRARFEEAVALAESAFLDEFAKLVGHLAERIAGDDDGQPKVFRDSAVGNLAEFFERFRGLNVRSNADLDRLVEQAQRSVQGLDARHLRESGTLRRIVGNQLAQVQAGLDQLLVDRPRRRILRPGAVAEPAEA